MLAGQKRKYLSNSNLLPRREAKLQTLDLGPSLEDPKPCAACSSINFDQIFAEAVRDWRGNLVKDLGLITQEWETRNCGLCRLWVAMRPIVSGKEDDQRYQHFHLRAFSSMKSFVDTYSGLSSKTFPQLTDTIFLSIVVAGSERSGTQNSLCTWWKHTTKDTGFIASVPTLGSNFRPPGTGYSGQLVKANAVDYQLLRYYIEYCEKRHIRSCDTRYDSTDEIPFFRVLDCETEPLVVLEIDPRSCCYLALSYVWGSRREEREKSPPEVNGSLGPGLPDPLPHVIQDAVTATKKLGHRYLWVDRYCINQDPKSEENKIQIRNMDRIYSYASVCLIAAAGSDPSFGLPGVGKRGRTPQPCARVGNRALVSTMPTLESELISTIWITRGWTYQEVLLSQRRLFFTEKQVYFECNVMHCCEAVQRPLDALHNRKNGQLRSNLEKPVFASQLRDIWQAIPAYTKRCLTKPEDILNGISGIFGWHMKLHQPLYHICGIPFPVGYNTVAYEDPSFVLNLFWQHLEGQRPSRRRHGFPSWSWCGWFGEVSRTNRRSGRVAGEVEVWLQVNLEALSTDGWARLENIEKEIKSLQNRASDRADNQTEYIATQLALCHTIRIKSMSMEIRLKCNPHPPRGVNPWLAMLGNPCDHCAATPYTEFFLTRATDQDVEFRKQLRSETFTGLVLGHTDRAGDHLLEPYCPRVLVVNWQDEKQTTAERIGFFCIRSSLVRVNHTCGRKFDPHSIPTSLREVIIV